MAATVNRERRVAALETRRGAKLPIGPLPLITAQVGETSEDAVRRYEGEHGKLPDYGDYPNAIVFIPVEPSRRAA